MALFMPADFHIARWCSRALSIVSAIQLKISADYLSQYATAGWPYLLKVNCLVQIQQLAQPER
jgi:DNA-binding transcriptional regulator YdaS (Cro superfamily)